MSNDFAVIRSMIIYAICLPLAIFLGYMITDPLDRTTDIVFGMVLFLLILPLLLKWYHAWLIAMWNSAVLFYFLPGQLQGWVVMAGLAFSVAIGHYILNRERRFLSAPSVTASLIFLTLVTVLTAKFRGGLGLLVLGDSSIGGKRYLFIWLAIMGYFALTSQAIEPRKRNFYALLFVLSGATNIICDIGGMLGGPFHFLFLFFPLSDSSNYIGARAVNQEVIDRFGGIATGCIAIAFGLVVRYGIEEVLNLRKLWRPILFFGALFMSTFGGFRSMMILICLTLALVFYFEGLHRSRLMPIFALGVLLCGGLIAGFTDRMPLSFQRCLAFLPVHVDPIVKMNAEATSDWRLEIWQAAIPEIPRYFFLGRGLTMNERDWESYRTLGDNQVGGEVGGSFALASDYHNGPLSLIIPFGIWGVIAFLWFLAASIRVLWLNYKYGDPDSRRINTYLLSYFIAKAISFFFIFGGFYYDLMGFIGVVGFSISLNSGVAKKPVVVPAKVVFQRFRPRPIELPEPTT